MEMNCPEGKSPYVAVRTAYTIAKLEATVWEANLTLTNEVETSKREIALKASNLIAQISSITGASSCSMMSSDGVPG